MKKCPYCKAEIEENARFCLYCMKPLEEKKTLTPKKRRLWPVILLGVLVLALIGGFLIWLMTTPEKAPPTLAEAPVQSSSKDTEPEIPADTTEDAEAEIPAQTELADSQPSSQPVITTAPTTLPTTAPTTQPTTKPTQPTTKPTQPTEEVAPTTQPTQPTTQPTTPTTQPTKPVEEAGPTTQPTTAPTTQPTTAPTTQPTTEPVATSVFTYRTARAGDDFSASYMGSENDIVITGVTKKQSTYRIPSSIDGKRVLAVMANAFHGSGAKKVYVASSVKTIWNYAFNGCDLTDIYFYGNSIYVEAKAFSSIGTIHCSANCHDRNLRYYKNSASSYGATYEEWNG